MLISTITSNIPFIQLSLMHRITEKICKERWQHWCTKISGVKVLPTLLISTITSNMSLMLSGYPASSFGIEKEYYILRQTNHSNENLKMYFLLRKWGCSIAMSVYQRVYTPPKSKECSKNSAWKTIWLPFDPWLYIGCRVKGLFVKGKALVDL